MKEIIFLAYDMYYEGNDELYTVHILPNHLLFSIAFTGSNILSIKFYKDREDFTAQSSICDLELHLGCFNEFDDEVIVEAVGAVDNCSIFQIASSIVMDYIATQIRDNKHINTLALGRYVKENFDSYVRHCVVIFADTEEGKELIETNERINNRDK